MNPTVKYFLLIVIFCLFNIFPQGIDAKEFSLPVSQSDNLRKEHSPKTSKKKKSKKSKSKKKGKYRNKKNTYKGKGTSPIYGKGGKPHTKPPKTSISPQKSKRFQKKNKRLAGKRKSRRTRGRSVV